jgi:hypothetical protein
MQAEGVDVSGEACFDIEREAQAVLLCGSGRS